MQHSVEHSIDQVVQTFGQIDVEPQREEEHVDGCGSSPHNARAIVLMATPICHTLAMIHHAVVPWITALLEIPELCKVAAQCLPRKSYLGAAHTT
jgi:hypothetical protein